MKKVVTILLILGMILSVVACAPAATPAAEVTATPETVAAT